ncbi:MAG: adenylyltransferase/cytidyltransferase family protein [Desulfarculaceae bacterium]|nr:adenylyltransferase/cytidyltransferase family protein [Desulfarculaceae bacterium]MCF8072943.1 adenylyltransferase/cytidyltransferase family protein [Desulfarculaceae bacterium]MCF8101111.1 adenylyltransferase/cytidyltransferase family protein [Desulfarculaceae bacterium]MCF8115502.1 adenylyltransferase/cytidyltransferase family protein [Desulfarculaceae bacterium]
MITKEERKRYQAKIKTPQELAQVLGPRPRGQKVIMCHGTFDLVHPGHIRHLIYAKSKASILVASLTSDEHVIKADMRPYVPEDLRALNLAALEMVDYVIIDRQPTPLENLSIIMPDYFAKGYEYMDGDINPKTQDEIKVLESYGGEMIFTPGDIVYSSSSLIDIAPPDIRVEKLVMVMEQERITFADLRQTLKDIQGLKVHVVGDTIVDTITHCTMIGGMSKTPTISVRYLNQDVYAGGAAVVAKHLKAAGAKVTFSTVLGDDELKDFVLDDLKKWGINTQPIIDPTRPTTNKDAIEAGGYRLLKVDHLDNRSVSERIQGLLVEQIKQSPGDIVVFSDFRHGIFNRHTIPLLVEAVPEGSFRVADSQVASRWGNIMEYEGFDLITPNEREARFALGDQDSVVRPLVSELWKRSRCRTAILKLGERGILTARTRPAGEDPRSVVGLDSFVTKLVDPVGSGDALLAYAALALNKTGSDIQASILGSLSAAVECEVDGNIPVSPKDILEKIDFLEKLATMGQGAV